MEMLQSGGIPLQKIIIKVNIKSQAQSKNTKSTTSQIIHNMKQSSQDANSKKLNEIIQFISIISKLPNQRSNLVSNLGSNLLSNLESNRLSNILSNILSNR